MNIRTASLFSLTRARILRIVTLCVAAVGLASMSVAGPVEDSIVDRIKPVGTVCVAGDDCAKGLTMAATGPRSGEEVYNSACMACHTSGAAGAPKFRIKADWTARLAAGLETVYANAINGKGAMPAKGLCGNCSDEEIKAAVDHMIEGI
ncbi:MAG: c-type cytochrome [Gammaproteobacteria bacterium]|nr:c-type cytochrome [Gammaproteobacteria bacterium]NND40280.1 cytochrome c5 family protein [Pseudomonadales bacterium]NNL11869.1 cytochrome c5 family protein [Pseudomonadales bacterium]NNM12071.1 cytochrome c5 family protein [Pseudomonadales bacterium]RZV59977.1 MAG: cytochrome c5 family protein [Pseudomonadales bacterium]